MGKLSFISAGAGTGKTYRLTEVLYEKLLSGRVKPNGVIATTFTRKAATELRERLQSALLERGEAELANAMAQARIGTVNSVCGGLVTRFAFEAGLSPKQRVLEELQASALVREVIDAVSLPATVQEIVELTRKLGIDNWEDSLKLLMDQARANDITAARCAMFGQRNAKDLLAYFPPSDKDGLDALLMRTIEATIPELERHQSSKKNTANYLWLSKETAHKIKLGTATWADWVKLCKSAPEAGLKTAAQPITDVASRFVAHPRLRQDIEQYLTTMFALAAKALEAYAKRKRELGVVDFVDQEHLCLGLLGNAFVVDALSDELDLLLVDEFQDTSPIQLQLFSRLSRIARETVWVGDLKQAIYGFRGSDAELMKAVLSELPSMGAAKEVLNHSRRSRPSLVHLVNCAFGDVFAPSLSRTDVELAPVREELVSEPAFANWLLGGNNVDERAAALAEGIKSFIASGYHVVDRITASPRTAHYGDIAVLCKSNAGVETLAKALRSSGVPWATQQPGLFGTPEAVLALACLRRLNDPQDTIASAEIVSLADCEEPESWVADRLRYLERGGESSRWRDQTGDGHPILVRLRELRAQALLISPYEAMELVIAQCDLVGRILRWERNELVARVRLANLEAVLRLARTYEDSCLTRREPATVSGLILWFDDQAANGLDILAEPSVDAVKVMSHHAAKGLEWPIVILLDLQKDIQDRLWSSVAARSDMSFDAAKPLKDRWIRYWPWPFGAQKNVDIADVIAESPDGVRFRLEAIEEAKRLLYVSMTRARDLLVFGLPAKKTTCVWLECLEAPWLVQNAAKDSIMLPDGSKVPFDFRTLDVPVASPNKPEPNTTLHWFPVPASRTERLPATVVASASLAQSCRITEISALGHRVGIRAGTDMTALGIAVHACIAKAFIDQSVPLDGVQVERIFSGFGLADAVDPCELVRQISALDQWMSMRWAKARRHVEVPIESILANGQVLHGRIDLLLEVDGGWVLLDHKANPASRDKWEQIATEYSGQLAVYAEALVRVTGRPVIETWIVLPVAAGAIQIDLSPAKSLDLAPLILC